jgi:hypothetical protein
MLVTGCFRQRVLHTLGIKTIWSLCYPTSNCSEAHAVRLSVPFTSPSQTVWKGLECDIRSRFPDICDSYHTLREISTIKAHTVDTSLYCISAYRHLGYTGLGYNGFQLYRIVFTFPGRFPMLYHSNYLG